MSEGFWFEFGRIGARVLWTGGVLGVLAVLAILWVMADELRAFVKGWRNRR